MVFDLFLLLFFFVEFLYLTECILSLHLTKTSFDSTRLPDLFCNASMHLLLTIIFLYFLCSILLLLLLVLYPLPLPTHIQLPKFFAAKAEPIPKSRTQHLRRSSMVCVLLT